MRPDLISIRFQVIVATLGYRSWSQRCSCRLLAVRWSAASKRSKSITWRRNAHAGARAAGPGHALGRTAIDYSRWNDTVEYIQERAAVDRREPYRRCLLELRSECDRPGRSQARVVAVRTAGNTLPAASASELVLDSGLCQKAMDQGRSPGDSHGSKGDLTSSLARRFCPLRRNRPRWSARCLVHALDDVRIADIGAS